MENSQYKILIVDDEQDYCDVMKMIFLAKGYYVDTCNNGMEALKKIEGYKYDVVLTDLMMPEMDGSELLCEIKKNHNEIKVIIMTAYGTIEKAVEAIKHGAYTYVTKGDNPEALLNEIEALRIKREEEIRLNKFELESTTGEKRTLISDYILETSSSKYERTLNIAERAARSNANILILGESGSGKEVISRFIHEKSNRSKMPFIEINCHSIPETMIESELFGHEKGAFTGAQNKRVGRVESSNKGTLFLDEIGDIPMITQTKLLTVLENKKISRLGSNVEIDVDFRLITATNKNLEIEISEERFREDLFYRLSTIVIEVPPLRERKEDLPRLISHFTNKPAKEIGVKKVTFMDDVMELLLKYDYPGNVRELKNIVERLVIFSKDGIVDIEDSQCIGGGFAKLTAENIRVNHGSSGVVEEPLIVKEEAIAEVTLRELRKEIESKYINNIINTYPNDMNRVAEILGITRRQLLNKIKEYEIIPTESK